MAEFYSARGWEIPPLPWTNLSPPFSLIDGVRESTQSWRELLLDLKRRGLAMGPELAVADGALGFWKAIEEVWSRTRARDGA